MEKNKIWNTINTTADGSIWERLCEDMYLEGTGNLAKRHKKQNRFVSGKKVVNNKEEKGYIWERLCEDISGRNWEAAGKTNTKASDHLRFPSEWKKHTICYPRIKFRTKPKVIIPDLQLNKKYTFFRVLSCIPWSTLMNDQFWSFEWIYEVICRW